MTVERQQGDEDMIIAQGLKAGEEVVIDGQLRLTPGSQVSTGGTRGEGGGRRRGEGREGPGREDAEGPARRRRPRTRGTQQ